ncbi:molybdopterin-dependent oxidoreductase [Chloroflexota bacterium]
MSNISLTIDGKQISVNEGATVLETANEAGIYIPTLCYHPYLTPYGGCRMCIVEIEGMRGFPTSCTTPASDGMVVHTNTSQLQDLRKGFLDFMLAKHPSSCLICDRKEDCEPYRAPIRKVGVTTGCQFCPNNKQCELQEVVDYVGITELRIPNKYRGLHTDKRDPFFERDYNLCILCGRCVRVCQEIRGLGAIAFTYRSNQALVGAAFGQSLLDAGCRFCGACVDICPTGALADRRIKWEGIAERSEITTCPYCGVGCQLEVKVKGERVIGITPADGVNHGQSCVRGRFGIPEIVNHLKRLKTPTVKQDGKQAEASWDEALEIIAKQLSKYKPDEIAVINCAENTNEDSYVLQKFARTVLGTNNIDSFTGLSHTANIIGLSRSLGIGAAPNSIADIENTDCIFTIGLDTGDSQPVAGVEIKRAVNKGSKLIVAGTRPTDLSRTADLWLQYRPGTDIILLGGIIKVIINEGLANTSFINERCEGLDALKKSLDSLKLEYVEKLTGVTGSLITEAARLYAGSGTACTIYGDGLTQQYHGSDSVSAVADLALLTGNIGKPSSGIIPMVGMNNTQGACDMGVMPDYYPGYQPVADAAIRQKFEAAWGVPLNSKPGLSISGILDAIKQGSIKACYIIGDHPLLHNKLEGLDFLVVQDMLPSPVSQIADVVLPMASLVETEGTFTSAGRRIQQVRQAIQPIGDSQPSWRIICRIANRMGNKGFRFNKPSGIMKEISSLTPVYRGISYRRLEKGSLQWPCDSAKSAGTPFLHEKSFNGGKARFTAPDYKSSVSAPDANYPLILTGEPNLYYFHTGEDIGAFSVLAGEALITINPEDASAHAVSNGDMVQVVSAWGKTEAKVKIESTLPAGIVSMPLHLSYGVMNPVADPVSGIPEYGTCPVKLEKKAEAPGGKK